MQAWAYRKPKLMGPWAQSSEQNIKIVTSSRIKTLMACTSV